MGSFGGGFGGGFGGEPPANSECRSRLGFEGDLTSGLEHDFKSSLESSSRLGLEGGLTDTFEGDFESSFRSDIQGVLKGVSADNFIGHFTRGLTRDSNGDIVKTNYISIEDRNQYHAQSQERLQVRIYISEQREQATAEVLTIEALLRLVGWEMYAVLYSAMPRRGARCVSFIRRPYRWVPEGDPGGGALAQADSL